MENDFAKKWFNELQVLEDKCVLPFPKRIKSDKIYLAIQEGKIILPEDITYILSLCKKHYSFCKRVYIAVPVFLCRLSFSLCLMTIPIWITICLYHLHRYAMPIILPYRILMNMVGMLWWLYFISIPVVVLYAIQLAICFGTKGSFHRESKSDPFVKVDWRKVLRYFIKQSQRADKRSTVLRLNKRFPYIHADKKIYRQAKIAIPIDQSESVSDQMLKSL